MNNTKFNRNSHEFDTTSTPIRRGIKELVVSPAVGSLRKDYQRGGTKRATKIFSSKFCDVSSSGCQAIRYDLSYPPPCPLPKYTCRLDESDPVKLGAEFRSIWKKNG